jgi:hypothetical protein
MRRSLRLLLMVCIAGATTGCGLCGRAPLIPQAYVAPAPVCDPCAGAAPVVARPAAVVAPAGPPPAVVVP